MLIHLPFLQATMPVFLALLEKNSRVIRWDAETELLIALYVLY